MFLVCVCVGGQGSYWVPLQEQKTGYEKCGTLFKDENVSLTHTHIIPPSYLRLFGDLLAVISVL